MRAELLALALTGCSFQVAPLAGDGGSAQDGRQDGAPPPIDGCTTFSQQLDTCMLPMSADLTLQGVLQLDTDAGTLVTDGGMDLAITATPVTTTTNGVEVQAWIVGGLRLAANTKLRVVGGRPLAIVARGTVVLEAGAVIDVSNGGGGARTACAGGAVAGEADSGGAAGGGGGGFGAVGGAGGNGNADASSDSIGGAGGSAVSPAPAGPLGGCPGAAGGDGEDEGGAGGPGGGAIYAVSAVSIELATGAGINAGGGGGRGGTESGSGYADAGGGGGGSGGMILLEAPRVHSSGVLVANGGGGGEASGNASAGLDGASVTLQIEPALGGAGGSPTGSDGGAGGSAASPEGGTPTSVQNGGGGGGGGGAGVIRVVSPDRVLGTLVSPAAS